jgi:translation initiation factor 3 subunit M
LISEAAYYYKLAHVRSLDPTSQSTTPAVLDAIATAVSVPSVFDFDPLFKLDAVLAVHSHPLFALLRIFLNGGLDDLRSWQRAHADFIKSYGTYRPFNQPLLSTRFANEMAFF